MEKYLFGKSVSKDGQFYLLNDRKEFEVLFEEAKEIFLSSFPLSLGAQAYFYPKDLYPEEEEEVEDILKNGNGRSFEALAGYFLDNEEAEPNAVLFMEPKSGASLVFNCRFRKVNAVLLEPFLVGDGKNPPILSERLYLTLQNRKRGILPQKTEIIPANPPQITEKKARTEWPDAYNFGLSYLPKNHDFLLPDKEGKGNLTKGFLSLPMGAFDLSSFRKEGEEGVPEENLLRDETWPLVGIYDKRRERITKLALASRYDAGTILLYDPESKKVDRLLTEGIFFKRGPLSYTFEELLEMSEYLPLKKREEPKKEAKEEVLEEAIGESPVLLRKAPFDKGGFFSQLDFASYLREGEERKVIFNDPSHRSLFEEALDSLKGKRFASFASDALYFPDEEATRLLGERALKGFDLQKWKPILLLYGERYGSILYMLFVKEDLKGETLLLDLGWMEAVGYSPYGAFYQKGNGFLYKFTDLLKKCSLLSKCYEFYEESLSEILEKLPPTGEKVTPSIKEEETPLPLVDEVKERRKKAEEEERKRLLESLWKPSSGFSFLPLESLVKPLESPKEAAKGAPISYEDLHFDDILLGIKEEDSRPGGLLVYKEEEKLEPIKEEVLTPEPEEDLFSKEDEADEVTLTPCRHLYIRREFLKTVSSFESKHRAIKAPMDALYQKLLTAPKEELTKFFVSRDSIAMNTNGGNIYKFRFSQSGELSGSRVFYTYGSEYARDFGKEDLVLLYFASKAEHDHQTEIALSLAKKMADPDDEIEEHTFKKGMGDGSLSYSEHPLLSEEQRKTLERGDFPLVFSGSAGTGKTLLSIELYRRLKEEHPDWKILYVTYHETLLTKVATYLEELGVSGDTRTYEELLAEEKSFAGFASFRSFLEKYKRNGKKKALLSRVGEDPELAERLSYIFYRGVLSGSELLLPRDPYSILSKDEFLMEIKDEGGLSLSQKEAIYEISKDYASYLKEKKIRTDNIASLFALKEKKKERFDAIIVDEAQDLTEVEMLAVLSYLKEGSRRFYLFGDDNQSINPSLFTLGEAERCLHLTLGNEGIRSVNLKRVYRSSEFLVSFINRWGALRKEAIGASSLENDAKEEGIRKGEKGSRPRLLLGKELSEKVLPDPRLLSGDTVLLFPSFRLKEHFLSKHPSFNAAFAFSIEEAKGLEWENVVIVDFLTEARPLFEKMLQGEKVGRHSSVHRMLFNRFYVALTRAENRILIVESDPGSVLEKKVLSSLLEGQIKNAKEAISYLEDRFEDEDWLLLAEEELRNHHYSLVRGYLSRVSEKGRGERYKGIERDLFLYEAYQGENAKKGDRVPYIEMLLRRGDYPRLRSLYSQSGEDNKVLFLRPLDALTEKEFTLLGAKLDALLKEKGTLEEEKELFKRRYLTEAKNRLDKKLKKQ